MHSQGRAGAQNAQWTHRWDSGSRVVLGSDRDNKGGWKCWSAQVAIMAMISTPSWNRPPLSVGRQLYLGFFLASLAMFVLTKVRGVSENRIKGRQIGAFVAAAVVIVPSSCWAQDSNRRLPFVYNFGTCPYLTLGCLFDSWNFDAVHKLFV